MTLGKFLNHCYGLNWAPHPHFYVEVLTPSVMVFGDENYGRYLGLDEVMMVGPYDGFSVLKKETLESLLCEDTVEAAIKVRRGSHQKLTRLAH